MPLPPCLRPDTIAGNLGGLTLSPGVYTSAAAIAITGNLILDAGGDANAVFVFPGRLNS